MFQHWADGVALNWATAMQRPVLVKRLRSDARLPEPAKQGDVGFDLVAIDGGRVQPRSYASFSSGLAIAMPQGLWAMIVGRSSTWRTRGLITMMGIIDTGYTGELLSGVYNPSDAIIDVEPGARLKQVIFMPAIVPAWQEVVELPVTARGATGFGSTGA
jgi:dUTP pyrophosphatase